MNWNIISASLLLLLVSGIFSSQVDVVCSRSANPLITYLVSQKVEMIGSPKKMSGRCGIEWENWGTCCDEKSLDKYLDGVKEQYRESNDDFIKDLEQFLQKSDNIVREYREQMAKESKKRVLAVDKEFVKNRISKFESEIQKKSSVSGQVAQEEMKLWNLVLTISKDLIDLDDKNDKCRSKLERVVSESTCFTCSPRSQVFFKSGKAQINIGDCKAVIDDCGGYWKILVNLVDQLSGVEKHLENFRGSNENFKKMFAGDKYKDLINWINKNNLRDFTSQCVTSANCPDDVAASLCMNLISLKHMRTFEVAPSRSFSNNWGRMLHVISGSAISEIDIVQTQYSPSALTVGSSAMNIQMP